MDIRLQDDFVVHMVAGSELDYGFDWSAMLAPGETILSSTWEIDNTAFVHVDDAVVGAAALVRIGGGVAGRSAHARNTVTTTINVFVKRIRLVCIAG